MSNRNELYYIIKSKFDKSKYGIERVLDTHDKAEAVAEAKKLKELPEIISIRLMERLYGYEDRVIYEFERG